MASQAFTNYFHFAPPWFIEYTHRLFQNICHAQMIFTFRSSSFPRYTFKGRCDTVILSRP